MFKYKATNLNTCFQHSRLRNVGFTLTEMLLVLGVISSVTAAVIAYARNVMVDTAIAGEASRLRAIASRIENSFAARTSNYLLLDNTFAIANIGLAGIFDVTGSTISGTYSAVTLGSGADGPSGAANSSYRISYGAGVLSASRCISLVASAGASFKLVRVGGTIVKAVGSSAPNMTNTTTACTAGGAISFVGYNS